MPVGSNPDKIDNQNAIASAAGNYNIKPLFPSYDTQKPSFDLYQALDILKGCKFVLADLTLERPSCYYELGLAEALGKKIYITAKTNSNIHQTSHRKNINYYDSSSELKKIIEKILSKEDS